MSKMLRKGRLQDLSLRAKFKDVDLVEITVVDHATGELVQVLWNWKQLAKPVMTTSVNKEEPEDDENSIRE